MGKIFYIMGKSASGKDTIYKELMEKMPKFHSIVPYTTRPMREGEKDGVEYFFVDQERFDEMMDEEKIIEFRSYNTKCGIWTYFTADDGQIELWQYDYLVIGTIESYYALKEYFGDDVMVPLYIEVEDGLRLSRALERERAQLKQNCAEDFLQMQKISRRRIWKGRESSGDFKILIRKLVWKKFCEK